MYLPSRPRLGDLPCKPKWFKLGYIFSGPKWPKWLHYVRNYHVDLDSLGKATLYLINLGGLS